MTRNEGGIHWAMGIGFGLYFWLIIHPGASDFIFNLPWIIKFIVLPIVGVIAFAGSIIFPIFLIETLRKIGVSEGISLTVLGLGFLVLYATQKIF